MTVQSALPSARRNIRLLLVGLGLLLVAFAVLPTRRGNTASITAGSITASPIAASSAVTPIETPLETPLETPIEVPIEEPVVVAPTAADAAKLATEINVVAAKKELTNAKAAVLGLVEGITEFLPISSTGHLLVAERILEVGQNDNTKEAADAYTVIIQFGAILAVLVVSWKRIQSILMGLVGKSDDGRKLLIALLCALVPTAIIGLVLDKTAEKYLSDFVKINGLTKPQHNVYRKN